MDDRREKPIVARDAEANDFPDTGGVPRDLKPDSASGCCDGETEFDIIFELEVPSNGPN